MLQLPRKRTFCASLLASALLFAAPGTVLALDEAAIALGKQVFTTESAPKCAICHTLADAEAVGKIGPNLDELQPTEEQVRLAVSGGVEAMPAYRDSLTPEQIDAVAHYVAEITGSNE